MVLVDTFDFCYQLNQTPPDNMFSRFRKYLINGIKGICRESGLQKLIYRKAGEGTVKS